MKHLVYIDWLRIFATIAVVTIHTSGPVVSFNLFEYPQSYWLAGNLFEALSRCSVPLFVMISGALLLSSNKEVPYREFLKNRASKVFIPLFGWSVIYYIYKASEGIFPYSLTEFSRAFLNDSISIHFWFMYMILGIYLITPLVRIFVKHASRKDLQYFLLLWIIVSIVFKFIRYFFDIHIKLELYYVTNYVGYFILGYYLSHFDLSKNKRMFAYLGAVIGGLLTFFLTYVYTVRKDGVLEGFWYEYHSPNVLLVAVGVFIFFKYFFSSRTVQLPKILAIVNQSSFGIYLVHLLVMNMVTNKISAISLMHPILAIPISVGITIVISLVISLIMKRIPVVKKLVP